jgi:pimeloyl-ACP methyl ester carboxylesterase
MEEPMTTDTKTNRRPTWYRLAAALITIFVGLAAAPMARADSPTVAHRTVSVDGLDIFYREAGSRDNPTILLLHGFPTSSQMFRNLIPQLANRFHVVAPDYPGFGNSSMPALEDFDYTFDNLSNVVGSFLDHLEIDRYSIYMMDYGGPVGFRLATRHPERVESLIIQNANAYEEGLREFWVPFRAYWDDRSATNEAALRKFLAVGATKWQWTHGVGDPQTISPDTWAVDQFYLDRAGNQDIQLALFYDYRSNLPLYPEWQEYFRRFQPPTLIVWGANDQIFPPDGAHPFRRDLKNVEFHLLETGHFALEEFGEFIADRIVDFVSRYTS